MLKPIFWVSPQICLRLGKQLSKGFLSVSVFIRIIYISINQDLSAQKCFKEKYLPCFYYMGFFFYLYSKVWLLQYLKWHHPDILTSLNYIDPGFPQQLLIDHSRNWAEKEKKGQNNDDLNAVLLFKCLPCAGIQSPACSLQCCQKVTKCTEMLIQPSSAAQKSWSPLTGTECTPC